MRQEVYDLIDAVRALGIEITGSGGPKSFRIATDADTFWARILNLKRCLDAFDRSGGLGADALEPKSDAGDEKMKLAINSLLRLFEINGGDMELAAQAIRDAMEVEPSQDDRKTKKREKKYVSLPVFAPSNIKPKSSYSARINLLPEMRSRLSLDDLRRLGLDVSYVEAISGDTLAADPHGRTKRTASPSSQTPRATRI